MLTYFLAILTLCTLESGPTPGRAAAMDEAVLDDPTDVDLLMLTTIDYTEGEELPEEVRALDGQRVKIEGYTGPYTLEGSSTFRLITDSCGCDGPPLVQHFVHVDLGEETIGYQPESVTVIGTLSVGEECDGDYVVSIYRLQAESME